MPSSELSSLKNATDRNSTSQANLAEKKIEAKPVANNKVKKNNRTSPVNPAEKTKNTTPKTDWFVGEDHHKKVNDQLLKNGTNPSDIAYNSEGQPIITCDATGRPVAIPPGDQADAIKKWLRFMRIDLRSMDKILSLKYFQG